MTTPIRVVIVEDNVLYGDGLRSLLDFTPGFECAGEYQSATMAFDAIASTATDVILMDIDLPGMNGIDFTSQIKSNNETAHIEIIILTVFEDDYQVLEAILAGASGYLLKSSSPDNIMDAIKQVHSGGSPMSPSIARRIFGLMKMSHSKPEEILLNKRESEVLDGLVEGLTYKMIGKKHFMAIDTVRTYIRSIYEKLQVHSRSEAIVKAIKNRLL